jgi:hypothetical protein
MKTFLFAGIMLIGILFGCATGPVIQQQDLTPQMTAAPSDVNLYMVQWIGMKGSARPLYNGSSPDRNGICNPMVIRLGDLKVETKAELLKLSLTAVPAFTINPRSPDIKWLGRDSQVGKDLLVQILTRSGRTSINSKTPVTVFTNGEKDKNENISMNMGIVLFYDPVTIPNQ